MKKSRSQLRQRVRAWLYAAGLVLCTVSQGVLAERYALLVGIGDYPDTALDLDGPEHDINALEMLLRDTWGFNPANMRILRDSQATKKQVLSALVELKQRSKPGDQLFFYFSGHGTSAGDDNIQLPLPDMTAGLLPYDVKLNLSKPEIVGSLIVGRSDLKPIFQDIDQSGRQLLVMIDACYSGNAVRGFSSSPRKLPSRYVRLDAKVDSLLADTSEIQTRTIATQANQQAYPYDNVFFISASGEFEEAADISGPFLQKFPTIDGKPHGAFSDAMLRALSGKAGQLDSDGNQQISQLEIKQGIQNWLSGKFPQTPQHLPPVEEDRLNLASRGVFGYESIPGTILGLRQESNQTVTASAQQSTVESTAQPLAVTEQTVATDKRFRLSVNAQDLALSAVIAQVKANPDVLLTDVYPDIRLITDPDGGVSLRSGADDLIIRYPQNSLGKVIGRIQQEVRLHKFFEGLRQNRAFEISVDAAGKQNNGPHLGGEFVQFNVRTARNAWLILLNIDREGGINILFPAFNHEQRIQPRSLVLQTPEIEVVPPFGTDRIIALGFSEQPADLLAWMGELTPRISPRTNRLDEFLQLINRYKTGISIQELDFITVQNTF